MGWIWFPGISIQILKRCCWFYVFPKNLFMFLPKVFAQNSNVIWNKIQFSKIVWRNTEDQILIFTRPKMCFNMLPKISTFFFGEFLGVLKFSVNRHFTVRSKYQSVLKSFTHICNFLNFKALMVRSLHEILTIF